MRSLILNGAKVRLYVNGQPFARVTDFSYNIETPLRALYGIESMEAFELAPTIGRVTGSMNLLKLQNDGGTEGVGITVPFALLARALYFSIALVEIQTGNVIFEARQCSATSQRWGVATRSFISGQVSFEALNWTGEVR
jgi:hypothetical protein